MRKFKIGFFLVLSAILVLSCSGTKADDNSGVPKIAIDSSKGKVNIVFWHSFGGRNGDAIKKLVAEYNASQDKVVIQEQYQGSYDEAIAKLRATQAGAGPDLMSLYDIGQRWAIDSKYTIPVQKYIDAEKYSLDDYEPNILAYYTLDGTLYSMPFNSSTPVLLYNKEAFKKAGIDPVKDVRDFDSAMAAAQKLVEKGGMKVGGILPNYSWVFEQEIGQQGKDFLDNGNGRTSRATKTVFDSNGAGLALLTAWKKFTSSKYTATFGQGTNGSKKEFATGSVGFIIDSVSVYADVVAASKGVFTVGFAPVPKVNAQDEGGVSVGGGSLWLMDNKDANKAAAAWDFIKFATKPDQQAEWSTSTGYMPIRKSATELASFKDYVKNVNPDKMVPINALRSSKPQYAGSVMGVFPQARNIVQNEIEKMLNDKTVTPEAVLSAISKQINDAIDVYNKTN